MCLVYLIRVQCNRREYWRKKRITKTDRSLYSFYSRSPRYVHLEWNKKTDGTAVFGRICQKTIVGMRRTPQIAHAAQSQQNLLPFIHHCRRRLSSATMHEFHRCGHSSQLPDGETRLAGRNESDKYVNRVWRLNANAVTGRNMRLHLDEKTCDDTY